MGAGTTSTGKLMDALNPLAVAILGAGNVYQGKNRFGEAIDKEESQRGQPQETQGFFCYWVNTCDEGPQTQVGDCLITGYLEIHSDPNTTSDMNSSYDLATQLVETFSQESNFVSIGCRPKSIKFEREPGDDLQDAILKFVFAMEYQLPISCGA